MPPNKSDTMRGLASFITDMRNCKSKEEEERRINKELANIRSKFKGDKTLDGYQKKKYVCKLLFIFLSGHEIDFGYTEAVNLLCSNRYTEKQMGYLFISVLVRENHPLMNLVITRLKDDLSSRNPIFVNLALQCVANIGTKEMAENFASEIPKLITSGDTIDAVKQNAALCMLRFIRVAPETVAYQGWPDRVIHLINDQHLGVVTSAVSLIDALVKRDPEENKNCVSLAVSRLNRLVSSPHTDLQDYTYYFVTAPWLCIKFIRLLQNFPPPMLTADKTVKDKLTECLDAILKKVAEPPKSKKVQHPNARNAILFEAINLIIHMDSDPKLLVRASNQLGQFLQHKETNLRYLALESLCLLATSVHSTVVKHQDTVIAALKAERDVSVRQRAVDLLYAMCDRSNAQTIVAEMLSYLETADYSIREEMVLKVAILSEKYATDYSWYVDTILNLIRVAGDYVSEEVWHRVIQIVINRVDLQGYVAKTVFEALQAPACHENMVKVGGYILGEFGNLIAADPRSPPKEQFDLLHSKYYLCSAVTRQLLLTTYMKFINLFPEIKEDIQEALRVDSNHRSSDVEIQQRASEYLALSKMASMEVLANVLEVMPPYSERESSILSKLHSKKPTIQTANNKLMSIKSQEESGESQYPKLTGNETSPVVDLLELSLNDPEPNNNGMNGNRMELILAEEEAALNGMKPATNPPIMNRDQYEDLIGKPSGLLFENDLIQIGIKSEYKVSFGRLGLFYGNKASASLFEFQVAVSEDTAGTSLHFEAQQIPNVLTTGAQVQQMIHVECLGNFDGIPVATISFKLLQNFHTICIYLPITLNKFLVPADMTKEIFRTRWEMLSKEKEQMCQKVVDAKRSMDTDLVKQTLRSFGFAQLDEIDPNPNNYTCAGIINVTNLQVGVLMRIETAVAEKKYRLTVLSTNPAMSKQICNLAERQL